MSFQKFFVPIASVILIVAAYRASGWGGVAMAVGVLMMWLLLQFTRMMQVLRRAANRPIGFVGSAVMLNAKLKAGVTLLHVVAMTRALGEQISPKDTQPEIFRWTDETASFVTCEFQHGKLQKWALERPIQSED
jgi:Flp pilus assembly protein TadB